MQDLSAHDSRGWRRLWRFALIFGITVAAYLPVWHAGFIWDDESYIEHNATLRDVQGLHDMWLRPGATPQYYPLTFTTFWIEHHLWGENPRGYHVINVLLHAASACLVWLLLRQLQVPGALLAALIFAVHPVHVESVAWITERKNTLSGFFYLSSALAYLRFSGIGGKAAKKYYWMALMLLVCALLSKTVTSSLAVVLAMVLWWKRKLSFSTLLPLVPMLIAGAAMGFVTATMEHAVVGAIGNEFNLTFADRLIIAGRAIVFYIHKLIIPWQLSFNYERWQINARDASEYVSLLMVIVFLAAALYASRRIGRGPLVAMLFFIVTLAPALGFVNVYPMRFSFVADHFQYLASIGIIALLTAILSKWRVTRVLLWLVIPALSVGTFMRCKVFENRETLWRDTIEKNEASWLAHQNLAVELHRQGRWREAIPHYREAVSLDEKFYEARFALGALLGSIGELEEAEQLLREAIALQPRQIEARHRLAMVLVAQHRYDEALREYTDAYRLHLRGAGKPERVELAPDLPSADEHVAAGERDEASGNPPAAAANFLKALSRDENNERARAGVRRALGFLQNPPENSPTGKPATLP